MLKLENVTVVFNQGTVNEKVGLNKLNLSVNEGDFITIIGSNGAGKSTLFKTISGANKLECGQITLAGNSLNKQKEYQRAKNIGHLFQDPLKGTAPNMTIAENLGLAFAKGTKKTFSLGVNKKDKQYFKELLTPLNLGLEERLDVPVKLLSGGQRQALTLLMSTIVLPKLLLLDEHTAALDPKTSVKIMEITQSIIKKNNLTTLMITHNIADALKYGNKLLLMHQGEIIRVINEDEKKNLTIDDVLKLYSSVLSDRNLLF